MKVVVLGTESLIAEQVADQISAIVESKPAAILGTATGASPLSIYRELGRRVIEGRLSLKEARSFQLDEYIGLPVDHPQCYHKVIVRDFASFVDIAVDRVHAPDGAAHDVQAAAFNYEAAIKAAGGVDYQILGIGVNGHIGFNEPGTSFDSRTHRQELSAQTREYNARFFGGDAAAVPAAALTQGIGTILEARQIGLVALGETKAAAVKAMVEGPLGPACPASALRNHSDCTVYLDEAAAALLTEQPSA